MNVSTRSATFSLLFSQIKSKYMEIGIRLTLFGCLFSNIQRLKYDSTHKTGLLLSSLNTSAVTVFYLYCLKTEYQSCERIFFKSFKQQTWPVVTSVKSAVRAKFQENWSKYNIIFTLRYMLSRHNRMYYSFNTPSKLILGAGICVLCSLRSWWHHSDPSNSSFFHLIANSLII